MHTPANHSTMHPALEPLDPLALDRAIAETARAARRWLRKLGEASGYDVDPFEPRRWATGQTAFAAVEQLPEDDPLRAPLRRWVYRLVQLRVNREALIAESFERRARPTVLRGPEELSAPPAEALERALARPAEREAWLDVFVQTIEPSARIARLIAQRRAEVASRLGLASPDDLERPHPRVRSFAERWLDQTDDAFAAERPESLHAWIAQSSAEGLSEGFPAALTPTSLGAWFRDTDLLRSLDLDPGRLPPSVSASSTLRALGRLGAALIDASAPADQPFVIAHDPFGLSRRTAGALFAALPLLPSFAVHRLGLSKGKLPDHVRLLGRAWLLATRAAALRVLLRSPAFDGDAPYIEAYQDIGERVLGFAPARQTAGALFRLHDDDLQRFVAFLLSATELVRLRDEHDEDWFRNPRAIEELRARASMPPPLDTTEDDMTRGLADLWQLCVR